jgi:hypothetical protein
MWVRVEGVKISLFTGTSRDDLVNSRIVSTDKATVRENESIVSKSNRMIDQMLQDENYERILRKAKSSHMKWNKISSDRTCSRHSFLGKVLVIVP